MAAANPYSGLALDYLIGADSIQSARPGRVVEGGYDVVSPPLLGLAIAYANMRAEQGRPERYAPYVDPPDDIEQEYGEGKPDPNGPGWEKNLRDQFTLRRAHNWPAVELDNMDSYTVADCLHAIDIAASYGLKVIAKNVQNLGDAGVQILAHPNVYGLIVEQGAGNAITNNSLRVTASKPELPIWFVSSGDERPWAQQMAAQAANYVNIGVTYSPDGEYGSSQDLFVPIKPNNPQPQPPDPAPPQFTGADIVAKARTYLGQLFDGPDVPWQAQQIAAIFPDLQDYCDEAINTTAWCGIFGEFIFSQYGIRPPPVKEGVGFMWVDRWLDWGTPIPVSAAQAGDFAIFLGKPHQVTFVAGNGKYVGGNQYRASTGQSDAVTETTFRTPDHIRRAPGLPADLQPLPPDQRPIIQIGDTGFYV